MTTQDAASSDALFQPARFGNLQVKNRFIRSGTYEGHCTESGEVTDGLVKIYRNLARGDVGLIISGLLYVDPLGHMSQPQLGIHDDKTIPGLKRIVDAVHNEGGKILFQLGHAGRETSKRAIGQTPIGPSDVHRDPVYFVKPKKMTEQQIRDVIRSFGEAAVRAIKAGADGVQIHAAHGYLVNEFLSPFFNRRTDDWGGSDENRFRFLKEIVLEMRRVLPKGTPILVKLSTNDYTPKEGVTPSLAAKYAKWLADMGIDGLELSCGTSVYSPWSIAQGRVPVQELVNTVPWWQKPLARIALNRMAKGQAPKDAYNLDAGKLIKPVVGQVPVILVGGLRSVRQMQEILKEGYADFVSMSRPFIRDPFLVRRIKAGEMNVVSCESCNKCFAASGTRLPVRCYAKDAPKVDETASP